MMNTIDGHSMLFNTKALEWAGIDAAYAKKYGYDQVHVDDNGEPDGYVCEGSLFEIVPKLPRSFEDFKKYLLAWQDIAIQNGIPQFPMPELNFSTRWLPKLIMNWSRKAS